MTETRSATLLLLLSDFLSHHIGLHFPLSRHADLERGIGAAAVAFGFDDPEACVHWLLSTPELSRSQIETLASEFTVGETYFFRERPTFDALETKVLPELLQSWAANRRLRIWSAGCSTGEEAYSLAMVLARLIPDLSLWDIFVQGTDINPHSLEKAAAGIYTPWSFRDCPEGITERFFRKLDRGRLEIAPEIRKMVEFSHFNLVEDAYPALSSQTSGLDLILCRNVLMYFSLAQAKKVIARLHRCLREGGWLVVSSAEASHVLFESFTTVNFPGAILYRKDRHPAPPIALADAAWYRELPPLLPASVGSYPGGDSPSIPLPEFTTQPENPPSPSGTNEAFVDERSDGLQKPPEAPPPQPTGGANAMMLRARTLADQGRLVEALEWCDKAIREDKLDPCSHYLRGTILQEQGQAVEAALAFKRAVYLNHDFVLAYFALGNLERAMGRVREAQKHFANVKRLLENYRLEDVLPEAEGMTAGRLIEIVDFRLTIDD
jgi:chemotaxis protein methyltransferase CheR